MRESAAWQLFEGEGVLPLLLMVVVARGGGAPAACIEVIVMFFACTRVHIWLNIKKITTNKAKSGLHVGRTSCAEVDAINTPPIISTALARIATGFVVTRFILNKGD